MKKIIIVFIAVIGLGVASYFLFFKGESNEYIFRYDKSSKGDITVVVTSTGTLSAVNTVAVGSQVSGIVTKLYADFNSIVKAGQMVAQIDSTTLVQSFRDAEANLARVTAQYNESKRNVERTKSLFDKNLETQVNFDAAITAFESSKASLSQSQAQLERAKINLSYATIYAPINGVVISRSVDVGQTVQASFSAPTLFTIANDLGKMQVQATIDESDIGRIAIGQEVSFSVDAYPEERFKGTVSQIRLAPVVTQNVVNYTIIIDVPNESLKLMPGMTASVRINIAKKNSVVRVPNIALRFQPSSELIDSVKMKEMRESFKGMSSEKDNKDTARSKEGEKGKSESKFQQPNMMTDNKGMNQDSKNTNRGENKERSNFDRGEMKGNKEKQAITRVQIPVKGPGFSSKGKYEIVNQYPQYQKSVVSPLNQVGTGRVWIMNSQGKLEPIFVKTGLNDGQYTEILSDNLKEGQQLVIGAISNSASQTPSSTQNPLTGQQRGGQQMMMGGPGGRR